MLRIDFRMPLTALEIRDPAFNVCRDVATEFGLHATFNQTQQRAFEGHSRQINRTRTGNGKHKDWSIDFQHEPPNISKPTVVGWLAIRAPFRHESNQYGGFDYGEYGNSSPTYSFITVQTPSELEVYRPKDPSPEILHMTYEGLNNLFVNGFPRLFDVAELTK